MAQVHAMARMLVHVPQGDVEDASELVRLACVERDIAMDEAASSIVSSRRANDECERLRQVVNRLKLKKPVATPSHKATGHHTNLLLNLDFILSVFRNKLGLDIHVLDLKRHVLDQASSVSAHHMAEWEAKVTALTRRNAELEETIQSMQLAQVQHQTTMNALTTDRDALVAQLNTTAAAVADLKMENHRIQAQAIQRELAVDETMQTDELEDTASVEWLQDMLEHERATTIHCRNELHKAQTAAETADNEHVNAIKVL
ncbi:hypothetical protein DYB28_002620 [Aphanomyces astaci]|uniref:Uncharacterized protein n=1 Tax=Aphanomyces astaci TaxID=112090 RepID=A0A9X8H6R9_APHAT|nr:hypothetical protein DYB28_002620 [Aphanomyces astaci]